MSWFRSLRRTNNRSMSASIPTSPEPIHPDACLEVFRSHWLQVLAVVERPIEPPGPIVSADDVELVLHHVQQMSVLLVEERSEDCAQGRILDYLLTENILEKIRQWSNCCGEFHDRLKLEQLKMFELLVTQSHQALLVHKPVIRPLLHLLNSCGDSEVTMIQKRLVFLLHQLCVCLTVEPQLLELFFTASTDQGPTKFLVFSLLVPYVHHEGLVGQQARDALLLIMALSSRNDSIGKYIAENSDFCPVLATGLSGLYSSLPRKLETPTDDWCRLGREDWSQIAELVMFLNSLEFCNAVVQVAHPLVRNQLLQFIYNGFLVPVLGPALHQDIHGMPLSLIEMKQFRNSLDEVIAATAYLDLFIRRVTEPALVRAFLKFILTEKHDEIVILDSLITRINSNSRLCMASLALFKTLVDLHCEEVMFQLIFKYLIPCNHVMASQRRLLADEDIYGKAAEKFISLTPGCCQPDVNDSPASTSQPSTPKPRSANDGSGDSATSFPPGSLGSKLEHYETSYMDYVKDAHARVFTCWRACAGWSAPYDSKNPPQDAIDYAAHPVVRRRSESDSAKSKVKVNFDESKPSIALKSHGQCDRRSSVDYKIETNCDSEVEQLTTGDDLSSFFLSLNRVTTPTEQYDNLDESIVQLEGLICEMKIAPVCDEKAPCADVAVGASEPATRARTLSEYDTGASAHEALMSIPSRCTSNSRDASPEPGATRSPPESQSQSHPRSLTVVQESQAVPNIGPFLTVLLHKLDGLMHNSLYVNLLLTDLLAHLASHPQTLLRSFLINSTLIFQPSVKSLLQVLSSVKHKVDCFSYTVDNFEVLLLRARRYLAWRETAFNDAGDRARGRSDSLTSSSSASQLSIGAGGRDRAASVQADTKPAEKKRGIANFFKKFQQQTPTQAGDSNGADGPRLMRIAGGGYRYINAKASQQNCQQQPELESQRTKNAVYAAIVLEEFLKELAAIAQQHPLMQHQGS